ncbi:uncharacterized protein C7orf50 homolog isoform X8 [Bubalus bubalis]|uniref:uncharacterized protein C7orf50 homolog isoform X8 n=1 Tax=Bubalus bubalis TaxID=89462 RepID=UPI001D12FEBA|nr:uncharacterized protein C7orf50 homolog isoform X8 [Bubalus bubalis]
MRGGPGRLPFGGLPRARGSGRRPGVPSAPWFVCCKMAKQKRKESEVAEKKSKKLKKVSAVEMPVACAVPPGTRTAPAEPVKPLLLDEIPALWTMAKPRPTQSRWLSDGTELGISGASEASALGPACARGRGRLCGSGRRTMPQGRMGHAVHPCGPYTVLLSFTSACSVLSGTTDFRAAWQRRFKADRPVFCSR